MSVRHVTQRWPHWRSRASVRAIAHQLNLAKSVFHPDLKAVYAEEAGNLLAIRRALDQAIKKAVVDSVIGRGRSGGWSPP